MAACMNRVSFQRYKGGAVGTTATADTFPPGHSARSNSSYPIPIPRGGSDCNLAWLDG